MDKNPFYKKILEPFQRNEPIQLLEPKFGAPIAMIDLVKIGGKLNKDLYRFNYEPIMKQLFKSLRPSYTADLDQAIQELR